MKIKIVVFSFLVLLAISSSVTTGYFYEKKTIDLPIFPGAEGFGTNTRGPYGSDINPTIYKITNLKEDGSGSLKAALEDATEPRVIIFEVSGIIELTDYICVKNPYVYVAGQTAPSPGITLKGGGISIATHDIIIQHICIRVGDGQGVDYHWRDCLDIGEGGKEPYNVVIDHCSLSWAIDENSATWYPSHDITYQWCIISEALYDSYHPSGPHSMGLLIGPDTYRVSIHHNLFAHNANRNPMVGGYDETEIINNVVYNWKWTATSFTHYSGNEPQNGNIIGNYYKKGPNTISNYGITLESATSPSRFYIHDNIGPTRKTNNQDEWDVVDGSRSLRSDSETFTPSGITTQNAFYTFDIVLDNAGARPADRDLVDQRIVQNVRDGTGELIDSQNDIDGWPYIKNNYRELILPINPYDDKDRDGYTNLEEWIHIFTTEVETVNNEGNNSDGNGNLVDKNITNYEKTEDLKIFNTKQFILNPDESIFMIHRLISLHMISLKFQFLNLI